MDKIQELNNRLIELDSQMRSILDKAEKEDRDLTKDENEKYDGLKSDYSSIKTRKHRLDENDKRDSDLKEINFRYKGADPEDHSKQEKRDLSKYSFGRAISTLIEGRQLDGIEREMHQEGLRQYRESGLKVSGNLIIPQMVIEGSGSERRDLTATGGSSGSEGGVMVQTSVGPLINRLRARLMVMQMGATSLNGLKGDIDFPVFAANDAATEKTEIAAAAESSPTFTSKSMSPNRLPVFAEYSRQLLMQAENESVEALIRDDLAYQIAKVMDLRAINGSGTAPQPEGILNTTGIGDVAGGTNGLAPTWGHIVDLETALAVDDADVESLGYLTNPNVRGKLKKTFVDSSSNAERVWDIRSPGLPLNGYNAGVSTQVPNDLTKGTGTDLSAIIFGNWRDLLLGQWGGIEFLVNPYSRDTEGLIRLNAWTFYDVLIRRAQSFAAMKDAITT